MEGGSVSSELGWRVLWVQRVEDNRYPPFPIFEKEDIASPIKIDVIKRLLDRLAEISPEHKIVSWDRVKSHEGVTNPPSGCDAPD